MCIYLLIDLLLLYLFYIYRTKNGSIICNFSCLLLFLLLSCHNGIFDLELDYTNYMNLFLGKSSMYGNIDMKNGFDLEMPFYYLDHLLRIFPREPYVYIISIAVIFCFPLFLVVKRQSNNPALSILLLLVLNNTMIFTFFFSIHRQMMAVVYFLWAYICYLSEIKRRRKIILIILFCSLGLLSHSSSYFVLPIALALFFIRMPSKKYLYGIILFALFAGITSSTYIKEQMTNFMFFLGDSEEIQRSTYYLTSGIYDDQVLHLITSLPPMACLILLFVYCYSEEELQSYSVKCWIAAFVIFLSLSSIPLINRALLLFFLIGLSGAIPKNIEKKSVKNIFFMALVLLVYIAFRSYSQPHYLMLPYNFIWS